MTNTQELDTDRYFRVRFVLPEGGEVRHTCPIYGSYGLMVARRDVVELLTVRRMVSATIISEMP